MGEERMLSGETDHGFLGNGTVADPDDAVGPHDGLLYAP